MHILNLLYIYIYIYIYIYSENALSLYMNKLLLNWLNRVIGYKYIISHSYIKPLHITHNIWKLNVMKLLYKFLYKLLYKLYISEAVNNEITIDYEPAIYSTPYYINN